MLNTNMLHNVLNIMIALSALMIAVLLAFGCTQSVDGTLECSQSFVAPSYTAYVIAALGALKLVINITRDGISGLIKPQPPIEK